MAGALALMGLTAGSSDASGYAGSLHRGHITGIPKSVHRGQTITVELWFRQSSPYLVDVGSYGLYVWNPAGINGRGQAAPGVTVSWFDPFSKRWVPSDLHLDRNFHQIWEVPGPHDVLVPSGVWNHVFARVSFAKWVTPGVWRLESDAPQSWSLKTKSGQWSGAALSLNQPPLQPITVLR